MNLIKNQQSEKEQLKAELEKKDKIIDLMAETIKKDSIKSGNFWCSGCCVESICPYQKIEECIKEYYKRQVERGEK